MLRTAKVSSGHGCNAYLQPAAQLLAFSLDACATCRMRNVLLLGLRSKHTLLARRPLFWQFSVPKCLAIAFKFYQVGKLQK